MSSRIIMDTVEPRKWTVSVICVFAVSPYPTFFALLDRIEIVKLESYIFLTH